MTNNKDLGEKILVTLARLWCDQHGVRMKSYTIIEGEKKDEKIA